MDLEKITEENARTEIVKCLTENGYLDGAAQGIALQGVAKGRDSISTKQGAVFQRLVANKFFNLKC